MSYQGNSSFNHESESIDDLRTRLDRMTRWNEHQKEQIRSHEKEKKLLIEQNFDLKCDKEDLIKKLREASARPSDLNSAELTRRREQAEEQLSTIATLSAKLLAAEQKEAQFKKFMLESVAEQEELAAQQEEQAIRIRTTIDPPSNMLAENVEDPPEYGFGDLMAKFKVPKRQDLGDIIEDQQPAKSQAAKSAAKASGDGKSESSTIRSYTSESSEQPGGLHLSGRHFQPSTEHADSSVSKDVEESGGSTKDEDSKKADLLNPPKLSSPKEKSVTSANAEASTDPGRREMPKLIRKIIAKNLENEQPKVKRGLFRIKDEESMEGTSDTSPISLQQSPASSSSKSLPAPPTITVAADVRGANRSHGQSMGQTDKGLTGTMFHETAGQSETFAEATRVKMSEPKEREPRTYLFSGIREEPAPLAEDLSTPEAGKLKTDKTSPPSDNKAVVAQGTHIQAGPEATETLFSFRKISWPKQRIICVVQVDNGPVIGSFTSSYQGIGPKLFLDPGRFGSPQVRLYFHAPGSEGREVASATWTIDDHVQSKWVVKNFVAMSMGSDTQADSRIYNPRVIEKCPPAMVQRLYYIALHLRPYLCGYCHKNAWGEASDQSHASALNVMFGGDNRDYQARIWFICPKDFPDIDRACLAVFNGLFAQRQIPLYQATDQRGELFTNTPILRAPPTVASHIPRVNKHHPKAHKG